MLTSSAERTRPERDKQSSLSRSGMSNLEEVSDRFSQISFGGPSIYPGHGGRMPLSYYGTPMAVPTHANNPDARFRLSETATGNDFHKISNSTQGSSRRDATTHTRNYGGHISTTRNKSAHQNGRQADMPKGYLSSMSRHSQHSEGRGSLTNKRETMSYEPGLSTKISRATQIRVVSEERQSVSRSTLHDARPDISALSRPVPLAGGSSRKMGGFVTYSDRFMKAPLRTSSTTIHANDHVRDDPRKDKRVTLSGKQGQTTHMSGALPVPDKKSAIHSQTVTKPSTIKNSENTADKSKESPAKRETTASNTQVDKARSHHADSMASIHGAWMGSIDSRASKGSKSHGKSKK